MSEQLFCFLSKLLFSLPPSCHLGLLCCRELSEMALAQLILLWHEKMDKISCSLSISVLSFPYFLFSPGLIPAWITQTPPNTTFHPSQVSKLLILCAHGAELRLTENELPCYRRRKLDLELGVCVLSSLARACFALLCSRDGFLRIWSGMLHKMNITPTEET